MVVSGHRFGAAATVRTPTVTAILIGVKPLGCARGRRTLSPITDQLKAAACILQSILGYEDPSL